MKKLLTILMAMIFAVSITACGSSSTTSSAAPTSEKSATSETSSTVEESTEESTPVVEENSNKLGDYEVEILSARKSQDYEGKECVLVKYKFTNNSSEAQAFMYSISDEAYQDGVQLETAIIRDDSYNADDSMKKIKSGASIEVEQGFVLTSQSEIEIEASETFSFTSKEKITKVFSYSDLS